MVQLLVEPVYAQHEHNKCWTFLAQHPADVEAQLHHELAAVTWARMNLRERTRVRCRRRAGYAEHKLEKM